VQRRGGGYTCREQDKPGYLIFNIFVEGRRAGGYTCREQG